MIFPGTAAVTVASDGFFAMKNDNSSPWGLHADASGVTGAPTYDIYVSNKSALQADMVPYISAYQGLAITAMVSDAFLAFQWVAIKLNSNGATGTTTFYFSQNALKTVLY